jgi:D-alanine-D-alanine ligase
MNADNGSPLRLKIGLTFDLRVDYLRMGFDEEQTAEFDRESTVAAIEEALRGLGHRCVRVGNIWELARRLVAGERWDLVFNIAEGLYGFGREAQVPALLDAYRVPYTFSDPLVMALTLHKGRTKEVLWNAGVATPVFRIVASESELDSMVLDPPDWDFPWFIKPVAEGTGKGIDGRSLIRDASQLSVVGRELLGRFAQPLLVERYLPGREFTVGIAGTGEEAEVLAVMEVRLRRTAEPGVYSYGNKEHYEEHVDYLLAQDDEALEAGACALRAWRVLGCRDAGRVDLRSDSCGVPNFIEVNPLAGLDPEHSDLPILCGLSGHPYSRLIGRIVESAAHRIAEVEALPRPRVRRSPRTAVVLTSEPAEETRPDEDDNRIEAEVFSQALEELGFAPRVVAMSAAVDAVEGRIRELAPELVCNLAETVRSCGSWIHLGPSLLEHMQLPYTGARAEAIYTSSNKLLAKRILRANAIPTPDDLARPGTKDTGATFIVKSEWEHASLGLEADSLCGDLQEVQGRIAERQARYGGAWFAERYVDGREFNLALVTHGPGLPPELLPPAEIRFVGFGPDSPRIVGYRAKWDPGSLESRQTPRSFDMGREDASLLRELEALARRCWDAFELTGYARVDFRVDAQGRPWVLEVNTNPCVAPDSGFMAMLARAGLAATDLLARLIDEAFSLHGARAGAAPVTAFQAPEVPLVAHELSNAG